jgi:hypothetical protein
MAQSRVRSNAARHASYAARAAAQQALRAARSALGIGIEAARETARINSYPEPTNVLSGHDNGDGTARISIADHKRVYPVQGAIDVRDVDLAGIADIDGLANGTTYYVYYDDETLADDAPVMEVTTIPRAAQAGAAAGRHPVGAITTPTPGGSGTSGGPGIRPPGWGTDMP